MCESVFDQVLAERRAQDAKWGEQNHPDVRKAALYGLPSEKQAKFLTDAAGRAGILSWLDIVVEELVEAAYAPDVAARRVELIQLLAVILAWVECIDRRAAKEKVNGNG